MVTRMLYGADPFRGMRRLQNELNRMAERGAARAPEFPAVNAYANQDGVVITAELPGVKSEDLDVSVWDDALLAEELAWLRDERFDLDLVGFDATELERLLAIADGETASDETEDQVPEPPEDPVSKPGDLWVLGNHRLLCGDATVLADVERLLDGQLADMCFTDSPYNVDYANSPKDKLRGKHRPILNDNLGSGFEAFLYDCCVNVLSVTKGAVYWCMSSSELHTLQRAFTAAGGKWSTFVIWAKSTFTLGRADYQRQYEPMLYGWKEGADHYWCGPRDQGDVWFFDKPVRNDLHPTMGPQGHVVGLDPNEQMLAVARRKPASVTWQLGRAEALPFNDASFDTVVSQFALMFFESKPTAIAEMLRVLRPRGRVAVAVWDSLARAPGYQALTELLRELFGADIAGAMQAPFTLGDRTELLRLFAEAGAADAEVQTHPGTVHFASIDAMVSTERACVWTLGGLLDEQQFTQLRQHTQNALKPFVRSDGSVQFDCPAHLVTAARA